LADSSKLADNLELLIVESKKFSENEMFLLQAVLETKDVKGPHYDTETKENILYQEPSSTLLRFYAHYKNPKTAPEMCRGSETVS